MAGDTGRTVTVVVPAAGRASRSRGPIWCRRRPDGSITLEAVIKPLGLAHVARVIVVVLRDHVDSHCGGDAAGLTQYLATKLGLGTADRPVDDKATLEVLALENETADATETVCQAIERCGIDGPIFVKDCDGSFPHVVADDDHVCVLPITSESVTSLHDLPSKSFADECGGVLTNIVEKQIVSDLACVGGFGFASAAAFQRAQEKVRAASNSATRAGNGPGRVFTSHVALQMLVEETVFRVIKVPTFEDWKTAEAWAANSQQYKNVLMHLDGVLVRPKQTWLAAAIREMADQPASLAPHFEPIAENVAAFRAAVTSVKSARAVVLSSLSEASRPAVAAMLKEFNIPCDSLVLGCSAVGSTFLLAHDTLHIQPHAAGSLTSAVATPSA
uniref:Uncharacterized protein n=2 Tax=Neobodo designis TaxID=312471 RepID=A0A7S1MHD8_NEODS